MKQSTLLTVTSLLSILFLTIHLTSDFLHDASELSLQGVLISALILTVLLWGSLVLAERRTGHVIMLLGSLFALLMPVIHLKRQQACRRPRQTRRVVLRLTLLALGVTGLFSAVLSVRGLVNLQRGRPR
jgi:hypothetical protein